PADRPARAGVLLDDAGLQLPRPAPGHGHDGAGGELHHGDAATVQHDRPGDAAADGRLDVEGAAVICSLAVPASSSLRWREESHDATVSWHGPVSGEPGLLAGLSPVLHHLLARLAARPSAGPL